jgi:hypothetical protein
MLVSCSAYSSTLKREVTCSSETSVDFQRTTRRYIPEDIIFHNHRCEGLKSYIICLLFLWIGTCSSSLGNESRLQGFENRVIKRIICGCKRDEATFSPLLHPYSGTRSHIESQGWLLSFWYFTSGRTPWAGDKLVARPLPKRRTPQTQKNSDTH